MTQSRHSGDLHVAGSLSAQTLVPSAGCVTDASVLAATNVAASKLEQQKHVHFSQVHGSAATTERRVVYIVRGATATIQEARFGVTVACIGAATITIDVYKNGSSILSSTVVLDNTNTAYTEENATFSSTSLVADDVLELVITAAAGGGTLGQGLYGQIVLRERAD